MEITLEKILNYSIQLMASDIYIWETSGLFFRINGEIKTIDVWIIDNLWINNILNDLAKNNESLIKKLKENHDVDFAYLFWNLASFRVNWFISLWRINFVLRRISSEATPLEKLNLPEWAKRFLTMKDGLVLITWPTWSWKSTSMVAIVEEINKTRREHILTIEDPIEFVFKNNKSVFSQRELWNDTNSMINALKWFMREDPDIIIVWELRDKETVEAAIELAWTWHLVISTLHTSSAAQTISRLISFFPPESERSVRDKLADSIWWILCQRLIKRADWTGRIWIYEVMLPTVWVKNLIKVWEIQNLKSEIEVWRSQWMITMRKYADNLAEDWLINTEDYIDYFKED